MAKIRIIPAGMEDDDSPDDYMTDPVEVTSRNMKIKVIPHITTQAGLDGKNFDATLHQDVYDWFEKYKEMWNTYKMAQHMVASLHTLYMTNPNPLLLALKLFVHCPDCNNVKNKSLPFLIMEEVANVRKLRPEIGELCTDDMKMVAFNFVKTQGLPCLYKAVAEAYDLVTLKALLKPRIDELIKDHNYKDAAHWAMILGLTKKFLVNEIVFPLILQDRINIAEEYLDIAKELRAELVSLLDCLLNSRQSVRNNCDELIAKYNITDVKLEKIQAKPLTKLIVRLSKKYNLPPEQTPFVSRSKRAGYLQYLVYKRYAEKSMNHESFRELLRDAVDQSDKEDHINLIISLSYNNDLDEAAYWSEYLGLSEGDIPEAVKYHIKIRESSVEFIANEAFEEEARKEVKDVSSVQTASSLRFKTKKENEFYDIDMDCVKVVMVNTDKKFHSMMTSLSNEILIAFDSEWKPGFHNQASISLIQIATSKTVFLIDVLSLTSMDVKLWQKLGTSVFNNLEVLKIGFSLQHDLIMFGRSLPSFGKQIHNHNSFLDLQDLWRKVQKIPDFGFPYEICSSSETLSTLVELCCGKKLDKSNQFSNWGNRPLREDQIKYAILDAHCLLDVYDTIVDILRRIGCDVDTFIENVIAESSTKKPKKKQKPQTVDICAQPTTLPAIGPNRNPVKAKDVKLICDIMLEGLARTLRKLGLDCVSTTNCGCRDECIKLALRDNRYLVTMGSNYVKFSEYLPYGHCYQVKSSKIEEQISEVITYFNVDVGEENVFTRCTVCNSNEFLFAMSAQVRLMKFGDSVVASCSSRQGVEGNLPPKDCMMKIITEEQIKERKTSKGVDIQVSKIATHILDQMDTFYICEGCGKIYWDGSHFGRFISGKLKDIIRKPIPLYCTPPATKTFFKE